MLLTKFEVNWLLGLGEEAKNRFSRWPPSHLRFPIVIFAIFDLQVIPMLPTKFGVDLPFGSGEEANDFQDGRLRNDFSYFLSISHPNAS